MDKPRSEFTPPGRGGKGVPTSQPACFGYDELNNMTTLRTFRVDSELITTDPSERADGDVTTWSFNAVTGLETSKTYADNTTVVKTYDAYNRLATVTDARGNVKTHAYEHARGLHLGTTYTVVDGTVATTNRSFTYNHLGQLTQLVDDAGTRCFGYNSYGERETDSLVVDGDTHLITEQRDSFGRSIGYVYSKNGSAQQTITTGFGDDGRIASVGFLHGGMAKNFGYTYLAGTNLLQVLTKPNGMTLTQTYEATRDLLTGMAYHRGSTLVAQRTYSYDLLGRPSARNTARQGKVVNDTFAHNTRSELVEATVSGKDYEYAYDNIGNREFALEDGKASMYEANALNQYTSISENGAAAFVPQFDADGNQTLIKTDTGIWSAVYNAENRPVTFTNSENNTAVECVYDSMGRRAYKKVTVNGSVTIHQRYIYRGYLQIACIDLTRSHHPALWFITWDPSQPVATRPLAIQKDGTWYTYGLDLTKNVSEIFSSVGYISTSYTYAPFGQVLAEGNMEQPIQWSSEYFDTDTQLIYYNYRYYSSKSGRWNRSDILIEQNYKNILSYVHNAPLINSDRLGLITFGIDGTNYNVNIHHTQKSNVHKFLALLKEENVYKSGPASDNIDHDEYDYIGNGGPSFDSIEKEVHTEICEYRKEHREEPINLIGWSRGGHLAVQVAVKLNEEGCCYKTYRTRAKSWKFWADEQFYWKTWCCDKETNIPVNFLGLFDPVDRAFTSWTAGYIPSNVQHHYIIEHTYREGFEENWAFQPQEYTDSKHVLRLNNDDGSLSKHGDIGGSTNVSNQALNIMVREAKKAGVLFIN